MVMAESFLKEQLKRIREMTEQMARVHDDAAGLSLELGRYRESAPLHPLADIRDFRPYTSTSYEERERAADQSQPARRHVARKTSRRRRR
jgi:hypothetical protein